MRRQLVSGLIMTLALTVLLGVVFPAVIWGIGQVAFKDKAAGSFVQVKGHDVGSSLLGQSFTDKDGNPDPKYLQPRPSAAGTGYDAMASSSTNLGPSNPKLVGFLRSVNIYDRNGRLIPGPNRYATKDDPSCVPVDSSGAAILVPGDGTPVKNADGSYKCLSTTVPQQVLAYRAFNNLPKSTQVPVDAVTSSGSGLDPGISVANANLQAPRIAKARGIPVSEVLAAISKHTESASLGFLGAKSVNVLAVNIELDSKG